MTMTPGVDMSTGSLGQGVSTAAGMAKAAKLQKQDINVYTLLGDGELAEGQAWEAFMFSAHYKLDNLCVIIDLNGLQIDGATKDVMDSSPVDAKMKSFGFEVTTIDGHSFEEIETAFKQFHRTKDKPFAIIMKTIKGKGVSFMENDAGWHGKAPNAEEYETAVKELDIELKRLEAAL
jgi:transketolase